MKAALSAWNNSRPLGVSKSFALRLALDCFPNTASKSAFFASLELSGVLVSALAAVALFLKIES